MTYNSIDLTVGAHCIIDTQAVGVPEVAVFTDALEVVHGWLVRAAHAVQEILAGQVTAIQGLQAANLVLTGTRGTHYAK